MIFQWMFLDVSLVDQSALNSTVVNIFRAYIKKKTLQAAATGGRGDGKKGRSGRGEKFNIRDIMQFLIGGVSREIREFVLTSPDVLRNNRAFVASSKA